MLGIDPKAARYTWTAAVVLLLLGVVYLIRDTLLVFVIALMFAYLLYPLLDGIETRLSARTRPWALPFTYVIAIGLIVLFAVLVGSKIGGEATQLAEQVKRPDFADRVRQYRLMNIPVGEQIATHYRQILDLLPRVSLQVLSASRNLIYVVIVPILSFFILKDGRGIRDSFLDMLDSGKRVAEDTLMDAHTLLLQYMRALLFLCLATFISFSLVLSLMGVPYAILLASIAFPLEFVPLVGPLAAAAIVIAVSAFTGYPHLLWVVIFLGIYRMFQDYVLSPHLMSKGVELHPLLIIFGVFAGGEIGGVAGVFLSVPVLALIRLVYHRLRKNRASRVKRPVPAE